MHSGVGKVNQIYHLLSQLEGLQGSADAEKHSAFSLSSLSGIYHCWLKR